MHLHLDCFSCLVRTAMNAALVATDDPALRVRAVREAMGLIAVASADQPPPLLGARVCRIVREVSGVSEPYADLKRHFNDLALALLPGLRQRVLGSDDPLATAVRVSIAGNVIDFGTGSGPDDIRLTDTIEDALGSALHIDHMDALREAAAHASSIVYLLDNTGEIVLDRLLIEQLGPERVVGVVRGGAALNDAVLEDAEYAGLTDLIPVIAGGSAVPGLDLGQAPAELLQRLDEADLVISKGQGNFELLHDQLLGRRRFFLFRAKCGPVADMMGVSVGATVVVEGPVNGRV